MLKQNGLDPMILALLQRSSLDADREHCNSNAPITDSNDVEDVVFRAFMVRNAHGQGPGSGREKLDIKAWFMPHIPPLAGPAPGAILFMSLQVTGRPVVGMHSMPQGPPIPHDFQRNLPMSNNHMPGSGGPNLPLSSSYNQVNADSSGSQYQIQINDHRFPSGGSGKRNFTNLSKSPHGHSKKVHPKKSGHDSSRDLSVLVLIRTIRKLTKEKVQIASEVSNMLRNQVAERAYAKEEASIL
ncbi:hypothetical protein T459_28811 [Capsicum annuum]|uniref:Uncharacterized protein n=1 Tax=Capsicum annuum TaxID=4072 RepID=A0A2G2YHV0_CAPAN|nr:hypothetical protein FXO37_28699 [Capsicum annuum]PHT69324.1 hypothetical protein T459_28811 [Capsicum annuum]